MDDLMVITIIDLLIKNKNIQNDYILEQLEFYHNKGKVTETTYLSYKEKINNRILNNT